MEIKQENFSSRGVRFSLQVDSTEIARAFLYILTNNLHAQPFGFLEDVFVQEEWRSKGYGKKIVQAVIQEARKQGCYKLIGTSRYQREKVHQFYKQLGFQDYGKEFRLDL